MGEAGGSTEPPQPLEGGVEAAPEPNVARGDAVPGRLDDVPPPSQEGVEAPAARVEEKGRTVEVPSILTGGASFPPMPELGEAFEAHLPRRHRGVDDGVMTMVPRSPRRVVGEFGGRYPCVDNFGTPIDWRSYAELPEPFVRDCMTEERLWDVHLECGQEVARALANARRLHDDAGKVQQVCFDFLHVGLSFALSSKRSNPIPFFERRSFVRRRS